MTEVPRIVSLVPSLTHAICDLGLKSSLIGCTQFCIAPVGLHKIAATIGGTKDPDLAAIAALKPTHILVNTEENKPEHIQACQALAPTFVSFPKGPQEVPAMLRELGEFLGVSGESWAAQIDAELEGFEASSRRARPKVLYYIWREPYMVAATDTYIDAMLSLAGYQNVAPKTSRYPEVTVEQACALKPDTLILSSEPYPFRQRDAARLTTEWEVNSRLLPQILKADGQLFSWYGTMTLTALRELKLYLQGHNCGILRGF